MESAPLGKQRRFQSLIDQFEDMALWVVSDEGEFDYISDGFEEIFGYPPADLHDDVDRLVESIHPADRDQVVTALEEPPEEVSERSYEARVVRPDGSVRWVRTRQIPIRDEAGNLSEVVGVSTDITEEKRREEELAALNRVLRHDVRNDMNIILGWTEVLEDHVDEEGEESLERISRAGAHIVELTGIARDYAEAVTGESEVTVKPVSLDRVLGDELELRRETFPEATFHVVGEMPAVEVRANEMLTSVFKNLLNNAVQHNDADEPVVEIRPEVTDDEVVVRIADDGPGIPDEQKDTIFQRGEKGVDSSGTGIGLYLVQTLVEQYGGTVAVADNSPRGAVFTVRLPRAT